MGRVDPGALASSSTHGISAAARQSWIEKWQQEAAQLNGLNATANATIADLQRRHDRVESDFKDGDWIDAFFSLFGMGRVQKGIRIALRRWNINGRIDDELKAIAQRDARLQEIESSIALQQEVLSRR